MSEVATEHEQDNEDGVAIEAPELDGTELGRKLVDETKADVTALLTEARGQFVSLGDVALKLAQIIVNVVSQCRVEVVSKKDGEKRTVPPWDRKRSADFNYWRAVVLVPLMDSMIPEEDRAAFRKRIDNHYNNLMHATATKTQKAHLGLAASSKAEVQAAKRRNANAGSGGPQGGTEGTPARSADTVFDSDTFRDAVKNADTLKTALENVQASCLAIDDRTRNLELTKTEQEDAVKLLRRSLSALMSALSHVNPTASAPKGAKDAADKVAA